MDIRMRHFFALVALLTMSLTLSSQSIGGGASLIFDGGTFGLQGRYEQYVTETIEGSAQLTFFLNDGSPWALDVDGHYNLTSGDGFRIYPLGGINFSGGGDQDTAFEDFSIGINVGGGLGYLMDDTFELFGEIKYVIAGYNSPALQAGILIPFGSAKDK